MGLSVIEPSNLFLRNQGFNYVTEIKLQFN